ncbi:MAG: phospho-N-acetylmuramoyl-pentapeptide-transferase [Proteobacteria bacterium]|nr:phospho-N-acetylmuramoyl-pentapeptide-transferase [Pseudomonadota bacterium]
MLTYFVTPLRDWFFGFNLLRYITFRGAAAAVLALVITFWVAPVLIRWLTRMQISEAIRSTGPATHQTKKGTPTMGGFLILLSLVFSTLLWADITSHFIWIAVAVTFGFGLIGFADDYIKVTKSSSQGVPGKLKFMLEVIIAAAAAYWIFKLVNPGVAVPFFKDLIIDIGWFAIPFAAFVIVGASNAVNLTDGLDGLAIMPVIIAASAFGLISYVVGNAVYSDYLQITQVPGTGELAVFCGAIIGAGLGFLWFNAPPAMVFMGDTGSLSLGGALGTVSVITKHELVLAIVGGLFVLEAVSVMVQVTSFKLTGKRIFHMAPLHHHFEAKGWAESTIVIRFWIIAVVLALIGLSTLKLR